MGRAIGDRQGSRLLEADIVRHGDQLIRGNPTVFGHAAVQHLAHQAFLLIERVDEHAVAHLPTIDARPELRDLPRHVETDDHRQWHFDARHSANREHVVIVE